MSGSAVEVDPAVGQLLRQGEALGLCARLLADARALDDAETLDKLDEALAALGNIEAGSHLVELRRLVSSEPEHLETEHVRLLAKGAVSPYETTYVERQSLLGGKLQQLADIAGFYRAFGFEVRGERPDHIVPELEFVAFLCVKEARAIVAGELEGSSVCEEAKAKFLREHLLTWLDAFCDAVSANARHPAMVTLRALVQSIAAST